MATKPEEWVQMANYKLNHSAYGIVVGSRIQRLGATISRDNSRSIFSGIVKTCTRFMLKANFQDSQCGAKLFHRNLIPYLFNQSFMTPWLFDIEIFLRLQNKFGKSALQNGVLEYPLMQWTEIGGSKIKFKDSVKVPMQLVSLYYHYSLTNTVSKKLNTFMDNFKSKTPAYSI